ncbi:alpha-galactosidase [Salinibacterium sp. CAN_S4]
MVDTQTLAIPPSSIGIPSTLSLLPVSSEGWSGTPGLSGHRGSQTVEPSFTLSRIDRRDQGSVLFALRDPAEGLEASVHLDLSPEGLLVTRTTVTNTGDTDFTLGRLGATLPVPPRAREVLDVTGRWSFERRPQRRELAHGSWSRQTRHGRNGHDSPELLAAGTPGFGFRSGEVWAVHLAFSGDHDLYAESHATGRAVLGAAELLAPGEITLAAGERYESPQILAAFSAAGLDGVSERFHSWARHRRPVGVRPVILNTWEAVYFDHDLERLTSLASVAASVGVERFVLDDGWMTGRTDDTRALGDWTVDPERWPLGLTPIIDHVHSLGMDFGLWVEPEMVSLDSDVARAHPEWVLTGSPNRLPQPWRNQFVLDLANPEAFDSVLGQLCALLDQYDIAYLKWDQNRDMLGGSAHRQTLATWRLMAELNSRYPSLEIESCSSGGGRTDLGVLQFTDRVWASDTNDPVERQRIQRYTSIVLPPEVIGSHLGATVAHTTGRQTDLGFRLATAFFGSAGIEWDLTTSTEEELASAATWIGEFKKHRAMLHSGTVVRADSADAAVELHGVVAADLSEAIFAVVCLEAPRDAASTGMILPGLDPAADYRVEPLDLGAPVQYFHGIPPWLAAGGATLSGLVLGSVGLAWPPLQAQQALVLRVVRL